MEKTAPQPSAQIGQNLMLAVHSLAVFIISYYLIFIACGLAVIYISYDFDIPATLYLHKIIFAIDDNDPLWTRDAVNSILLATPVASFIIGLGAVFLFLMHPRKQALILYFVVWVFIQAFNMTFGLLSENLISQTGLIRVAQLMNIHPVMMVVTVALSLFLMVKSGTFSGKLFYAHCSNPASTPHDKLRRGTAFFIFPWFAGNVILLVINKYRIEPEDIALMFFMLVLLIPAVFAIAPTEKLNVMPKPKTLLWLLPLSAAIVALLQYFFRNGISIER